MGGTHFWPIEDTKGSDIYMHSLNTDLNHLDAAAHVLFSLLDQKADVEDLDLSYISKSQWLPCPFYMREVLSCVLHDQCFTSYDLFIHL